MGNDLVERLKRLAAQHADGDPNYHGKRLLKAEDTMYWAAAARIEALEQALKPLHEALDGLARIVDSKVRDEKTGDFIFTALEWYEMHCILAFAPEPNRAVEAETPKPRI